MHTDIVPTKANTKTSEWITRNRVSRGCEGDEGERTTETTITATNEYVNEQASEQMNETVVTTTSDNKQKQWLIKKFKADYSIAAFSSVFRIHISFCGVDL